jgi:hypothetical protein
MFRSNNFESFEKVKEILFIKNSKWQNILHLMCVFIYIYIYEGMDREMRGEIDDDNKCALSQTYILTTAATKNEREKGRMSSYKCRYEKKCYLTIKHFSTLFLCILWYHARKRLFLDFFFFFFILYMTVVSTFSRRLSFFFPLSLSFFFPLF